MAVAPAAALVVPSRLALEVVPSRAPLLRWLEVVPSRTPLLRCGSRNVWLAPTQTPPQWVSDVAAVALAAVVAAVPAAAAAVAAVFLVAAAALAASRIPVLPGRHPSLFLGTGSGGAFDLSPGIATGIAMR